MTKNEPKTDFISVANDGPIVKATNYWESTYAKTGHCFFSINAGCIRLLLSGKETPPLDDDILTTTQYVIVTRGMYHGQDGYEVLFEDNSSSPFAIHTLANQWDRLLPRSDSGRTGIPFHIYGNGGLLWKTTARFRMAPRLPYLRPWK